MDEKELMRLAAQRAEWAGILIREIEEVCSVPPQAAGEVVNRLRDAMEEDEASAMMDGISNLSPRENGARAVLRALGIQNVTLANYCAAARREIYAIKG